MKQREIMFVNEKLVNLYVILEDGSLSECAQIAHVTYAHAHKIVKLWSRLGLLYLNKSGRRYNVIYSVYGKRIQMLLEELSGVLKEGDIQFTKKKNG